jgi:uncharacterized repeat protein (TIGR01451 family)
MTIILNDLPASVAAYINDNVTVDVTKPKTGTSSSLQPGDTADFTVTLTNKGTVRLINVKYHFQTPIAASTVVQYKVPASSIGFAFRADYGDPFLHGVDSDTLLVEPLLNSTLDPNGGTLSFTGTIDMHKKGSDLQIPVHMHADVDQTSLFPTQQRGDDDSDSPKFTIS